MKTSFKVENPDLIECTIKITMTLREWILLRDQLSDSKWPSFDLERVISHVVEDASKTYYAPEHTPGQTDEQIR